MVKKEFLHAHDKTTRRGSTKLTYLLLGIEADALANQVAALAAPHVERHLEPDDEDPLAQLLGAFPQRVLPIELRPNTRSCGHV
jgi:hypothetical protein